MSPPPVEALLFDFGGVVVEIDFDQVFARWAELAGVPFGNVKPRFEHGTAYQQHERGEIEAPAYFEALRQELGIDLTDADFEDGWQRIFGPPIEPVVALLPALRGRLPLYLFSNTNRLHHSYWERVYAEALRPFHRHFISFEMGVRKPEPESFAQVSRAIGVPLERILFFDDTVANIEGARAVGLQTVLVRGPQDVHAAVEKWL